MASANDVLRLLGDDWTFTRDQQRDVVVFDNGDGDLSFEVSGLDLTEGTPREILSNHMPLAVRDD